MRKTVRRHQSHRFFTPCHCSVSRFSLKAFSTPFRMTLEGKSVIIKGTLSVIQSASEESMPVVRKTVRRHQRNRFFTLCHYPVSHLSLKAFLIPFRMTADGKASSWAAAKNLLPSAYPLSHKNTVPITSDEYRILFLILFPYPCLCFPVYASGEIWEPYTSR